MNRDNTNSEPSDRRRSTIATQAFLLVPRVALVTTTMAAGTGFLAILREAYRASEMVLLLEASGIYYALSVAVSCQIPWLFVVLLSECQIALLAMHGSWSRCQSLNPLANGAIGGLLAYWLFVAEQLPPGPQANMLVLGGALVGYLGSSIQLTSWRMAAESERIPWRLVAAGTALGMLGWGMLFVFFQYLDAESSGGELVGLLMRPETFIERLGALGLLASLISWGIYLCQWLAEDGQTAGHWSAGFPLAWYVMLLLLTAGMFGATTAWLGPSPELKALVEYRQQHWANRPVEPLEVPLEGDDYRGMP